MYTLRQGWASSSQKGPSSKFLEKKGTRSEELGPVQQKELGSSKFLFTTCPTNELINDSAMQGKVFSQREK